MISAKRKKLTAFISVLVTAAILLSCMGTALAVSEDELDALKQQRDALVKERQAQQQVVNALVQQQAGVLAVKAALDERNMYTLQQLQLNNEQILMYDGMIADKNTEVEEAVAAEKAQLEMYRSRVRAMEENGNYSFLAMLLNTSDVGDFLSAIDDIGEIMNSDRELEEEYRQARENTEKVRNEYELYREDILQLQSDLEQQQLELQGELDEANRLIADLYSDIETNAAVLAELAASEQQAETAVANMALALEKQRQAAAAAAAPISGSVSGSGSFAWPVPSSTYVTSRFGLRTHPVYGTQKSHTGLDIGADQGSTIFAADAGTVTLAGVNGGYGNCVMIDHGNGYQTLYGHMSSISVSVGAAVSRGQTIGYVGSTGISTGPHCHFEVFMGGARIDPEQFYAGLSFSESAGV